MKDIENNKRVYMYSHLSVLHKIESSETVTDILEINPTSTSVKGKKNIEEDENGKFVAAEKPPYNGWFLSSEKFVDSTNINDHLEWIFQKVDDENVKKLLEKGFECRIGCLITSERIDMEIQIEPIYLKKMGKLNLPFWIDYNYLGDE